jgi:hypothetical protein
MNGGGMFKIALLRITLALMALLTACARLPLIPSDQQPVPSPGSDWNVTLTQSGGFAGVNLTVEITSDGHLRAEDQRSGRVVTQNLPPETISKLAQLFSSMPLTAPGPRNSNCADCFLYDLQANFNGRAIQLHADDTTLAATGAADLIAMLRQLRDSALRGQP